MKGREVVLIIFYDDQNKILLQYRAGTISKYDEEWGFFGGGLDKGETPEQALIRETKEELSFDLKEYEYLGKTASTVGGELYVERYIFISPLKNNLKNLHQKEGREKQLFTIENAKQPKMVEGDEEVLALIEKRLVT